MMQTPIYKLAAANSPTDKGEARNELHHEQSLSSPLLARHGDFGDVANSGAVQSQSFRRKKSL